MVNRSQSSHGVCGVFPVLLGVGPAPAALPSLNAKRRKWLAVAIGVALVVGLSVTAYLVFVGSPPSGPAGPVARFSVVRSLMRVDVNATASTDAGGDIRTYEWDFEDDGNFDLAGSDPTGTHTYASPGRYTIRLRVTDSLSKQDTATKDVSVATSTLDYEFWDFFNVPYGEWWDYRTAFYGERPIGAECFTSTAIANGVCTPSRADVPDTPSPPYTVWTYWAADTDNRAIHAPYRIRATGVNVTGYNLSEPVFLPVFNYSQPIGRVLNFTWSAQFLDTATTDELDARGCGISSAALDGYHIRTQIAITMDLPQSRRVFGVQAADSSAAQQWWDANTDPNCAGRGAAEAAFGSWFEQMGGTASLVGKYDIYNAYEWFLDQVFLDMHGTVDADGTTHVTIDHVAWGTANLLTRMLYWGNTSYRDHYLDSTKATGWFGMEPYGWFENLTFEGSLETLGFDFALTGVMRYHLQQHALPGPDGLLNRVDDIPIWSWEPHLQDYLNDFAPSHLLSELDRYPGVEDLHSTPGAITYNQLVPRHYVPVRWDLALGQTWHFQFPTGNVVFFDPNRTPIPADPASDLVQVSDRMKLYDTKPASYGTWDPESFTWDVVGPSSTGGPAGSPGPDGVPGTSDDDYADDGWGAIRFVPAGAPASAAPRDGSPTEPALTPSSVLVALGPALPMAQGTWAIVARDRFVVPGSHERRAMSRNFE